MTYNEIPANVMEILREDIGYNDCNYEWLTEKEIRDAGFDNLQELIEWNTMDFLASHIEVEKYIADLWSDIERWEDDRYYKNLMSQNLPNDLLEWYKKRREDDLKFASKQREVINWLTENVM